MVLGKDGGGGLFSVDTGELLREIDGIGEKVLSISQNGNIALSRGGLWSLATQRQLLTFEQKANCAVLGYGGNHVLTATGKTAVLWDVKERRQVRKFECSSLVECLELSPDGTKALAGTSDGRVIIWEVASGQTLATLISLGTNEDWLVVSPEGLFDGSSGARQRVAFRIANALKPNPVDHFFQEFLSTGSACPDLGRGTTDAEL